MCSQGSGETGNARGWFAGFGYWWMDQKHMIIQAGRGPQRRLKGHDKDSGDGSPFPIPDGGPEKGCLFHCGPRFIIR